MTNDVISSCDESVYPTGQDSGFVADRDGKVLDIDDSPRRQPDQLFDDIPEFADVAGPIVIRKRPKRFVCEAQLTTGARKEVFHQRMNVLGPLPERRHVKVNDAQPV